MAVLPPFSTNYSVEFWVSYDYVAAGDRFARKADIASAPTSDCRIEPLTELKAKAPLPSPRVLRSEEFVWLPSVPTTAPFLRTKERVS